MKGSEGNECLMASFASPSLEKQKEVMDSIRYAKRIQTAQLPSEKKIINSLERLMQRKT